MKIAYICADPGVPVLGDKGASVHVREFTDALLEMGHQVEIYASAGAAAGGPNPGGNTTRAALVVLAPSEQARNTARMLAAGLARLDSRYHQPQLSSEFLRIIGDAEFVNAAKPRLRAWAPDLVIARHALFSAAGPVLARWLGTPCVLEVNAPLVEERRRYWGLALEREAEQIEHRAVAEADVMVAVSEGVRTYLRRCGAPLERILVVPNGVSLARFHPEVDGSGVRRRLGVEHRLVIGFAGSLKPWHGVDTLLRAFASIQQVLSRRQDPAAARPHLLIVGEGPQREPLEQLSRELGVGAAVTFTGAVPHAEMPAHLAALDIAVAPYVPSNGFYFSPLKVMEYLAMGRPIVAPLLGQIPSLLHGASGPCGLLYPSDDPRGLAAALLRLSGDAALRRQLGARAAAQARCGASWQSVAQRILARVPTGRPTGALPAREVVPR